MKTQSSQTGSPHFNVNQAFFFQNKTPYEVQSVKPESMILPAADEHLTEDAPPLPEGNAGARGRVLHQRSS